MFTVTSSYVIASFHLPHNRNSSTILRSSHRRCSIKKPILKHFVIITVKHLCRSLFFNKVAGHQACNFIKKRLQHKYYLANIVKFIRRPILKSISERCENVFQIRSEFSKRNYWWLAVWKVAQISQDWIKMLPIIKYYVRRLNS